MIYLDNAATSFPKAPGVAEAVAASIAGLPGSTGRASHPLAVASSRRLFELRSRLAAFFGAKDARSLVFTKNATEALNLAIMGSLRRERGVQGDEAHVRVLCSSLEHNAVMRPLRHLEAAEGLLVDSFRVDSCGQPDFASLERGLESGPSLLVTTAASNVTGAVLPVSRIVALAKARGVPVLVDASQLAGHRRLDLDALGADYAAFPGHKGLLGPAGTGALYLAPGASLPPLIRGGTGSASAEEVQPDFLPDALESGTLNLAALEGLGAALDFLDSRGLEALETKAEGLASSLADGLSRLPGIRVLGREGADSLPVLAITCDAMGERELAEGLDRRGIACRVGLHCAPAAHRSIGTFERGGCLRLSPGPFTTEAEIESCLSAFKEILA